MIAIDCPICHGVVSSYDGCELACSFCDGKKIENLENLIERYVLKTSRHSLERENRELREKLAAAEGRKPINVPNERAAFELSFQRPEGVIWDEESQRYSFDRTGGSPDGSPLYEGYQLSCEVYQSRWEAWQIAKRHATPDSFSELRRANLARQIEWDDGTFASLSYKGNELAGETGELCNILKKIERERRGMRGSRATVEQAAKEVGDVIICADLISAALGINLFEAVRDKFNHTSTKYGLKERMCEPKIGFGFRCTQ